MLSACTTTGHQHIKKIELPAYISHQGAAATGCNRNRHIQEAEATGRLLRDLKLGQEVSDHQAVVH